MEIITKEEFNQFVEKLFKKINVLEEKLVQKNNNEQILRSKDVQKMLGVSSGTLQNLRVNGTLPYSKIGGTILYNLSDILKVIKGEEALKSKVIMISAVGQDSVVQEGLSIGAEDYIVKPFTSEQLVESVTKVFV